MKTLRMYGMQWPVGADGIITMYGYVLGRDCGICDVLLQHFSGDGVLMSAAPTSIAECKRGERSAWKLLDMDHLVGTLRVRAEDMPKLGSLVRAYRAEGEEFSVFRTLSDLFDAYEGDLPTGFDGSVDVDGREIPDEDESA